MFFVDETTMYINVLDIRTHFFNFLKKYLYEAISSYEAFPGKQIGYCNRIMVFEIITYHQILQIVFAFFQDVN